MFNRRLALALVVILSLVFSGVAMAQGTASEPVSDGGVTPYIIDGENPGGNRTCEEVGFAFFDDASYYEFSSARVNYEDGAFDQSFPIGLTVNTDGTYVSFSSTFSIGAVIVKGSDDANVYVYEPQRTSDEGLAAPINASGSPAGLSNITFCWNPEPPVCEGETAWGGSSAGAGSAWWFYYDSATGGTQPLWAGQNKNIGTVEVSAGQMTIALADNATLDAGTETVKVGGYDTLPTSRPAAGNYERTGGTTLYKGTDLTFPVGDYAFYAIHLDVVVCQ